MLQIPVIRRFLAGLMLVLFAFSITPKKALHDLVTNHRDRHLKLNTAEGDQVSKAGFNCQVENLVAESPFTNQSSQVELVAFSSFRIQQQVVLHTCYSSAHYFFAQRGPPAVC